MLERMQQCGYIKPFWEFKSEFKAILKSIFLALNVLLFSEHTQPP